MASSNIVSVHASRSLDFWSCRRRQVRCFWVLQGFCKVSLPSLRSGPCTCTQDKLQTGPDIRLYSYYFLFGYVATVVAIRLRFRMRWLSLQYDLLFYRFIYWFIAVLIAIFSPLVLPFIPYLNLPGLGSKLAIAIIIILLLSFVGIFLRLADIFKDLEESRVRSYWKAYATPDYEAILMGEEFDHRPEIPVSRWQRIKTRLRSLTKKIRTG